MTTAPLTREGARRLPLIDRARRRLRSRSLEGLGWVPLSVASFLLVGTRQAFTVPFTGLGLTPSQLLLLVLAVLWVLTRLVGQRFAAGLGVFSGLIVVRLCFLLISYGLASDRSPSPDQLAAGNQAVEVGVVSAVLVIVMATLLRTRRDLELVLRALVAGGALSGVFAIVQFGVGVDLGALVHLPGLRETIAPQGTDLIRNGVVRAAGAAAQPLELAAVTTTLIPIATAGWFAARRRGERAWPWSLAVALMGAGALVSLSRSLFVGLIAAGLVMALRWPPRRTAAVLAGALALVAAALVVGGRAIDAVTTLLTQGSDDFSLGSRTVGRDYVWAHLTDHFWWGQGPGTYDLTSQPVLDNQYLAQLIETGVVGLLASVAVLACALWYALQATGRHVDPDVRELATGLAGALAAVVMFELVLDTSGFVQTSTLIWLVYGLVAALWRIGVGAGRAEAELERAGEIDSLSAGQGGALRPGAVGAR